MTLQEPKVEFVPIEQNVFTQAASSCPDYATQIPVGGSQRCYASQEDAEDCESWATDIPWID